MKSDYQSLKQIKTNGAHNIPNPSPKHPSIDEEKSNLRKRTHLLKSPITQRPNPPRSCPKSGNTGAHNVKHNEFFFKTNTWKNEKIKPYTMEDWLRSARIGFSPSLAYLLCSKVTTGRPIAFITLDFDAFCPSLWRKCVVM